MQEAVLILIWCLGVVFASKADSWEPHDHEYINHHSLIESIRNNDLFRVNSFSNTLQEHEFNETDDFGLFPAFPDNQDMEKLLLSVTTEEKKRCVSGHYITNKCADCVCMGGQLYVCSMKPCMTEQNERTDTEDFSTETNFRRRRHHYRLKGNHRQRWTTSRLPSTRGGQCIPGKPLPMPDACSRCTCLPNRTVYCTSVPCYVNVTATTHRFTTRRITTPKPRECDPDLPIPAPDRCNTCICIRATETISCTNYDCRTSIATAPSIQPTATIDGECYPYEILPAPDSCNTCICRQDRTIYCTTANCNPIATTPITTTKPKREMQCVPFERLPQKGCGGCYCNAHGQIYCPQLNWCTPPRTLMPTQAPKKECIPHQRLPPPDRCNQCFCLADGTKHCTTNQCTPSLQDQMACTPNQPVPSPDRCNTCYCTHGGEIRCTKAKCFSIARECIPNKPVSMPGRCNNCFCSNDGKIMCETTCFHIGKECTPNKFVAPSDSCNKCVCLKDGIKYCTVKKCPRPDNSNLIPSGNRPQALSAKISNLGLLPRCKPNTKLFSIFKCLKCICNKHGKVKCRNKCFGKKAARTPNFKLDISSVEIEHCVPGPLPSPDSCNKCICTEEREVMCTARTCTFRLEDNSVAIEDRGCIPQTWFSMSGSKTCKECFCVNGKISFCYMNFCNPIETRAPNYVNEQRSIKFNRKNENQRIADIAMGLSWIPSEGTECNEGESFTQGAYHSCQGCFCSKERKWQCWSGSRHCQEPKRECELGTIFKNYESECSVCYCGPENSVVCATDQNCAKSLQ